MFDIHTRNTLYRAKITVYTVFVTCAQKSTGAMFGTVRSGKVLRIQISRQALVPHNISIRRDNDLAIKITGYLNLPGTEHFYTAEFERIMASKEVFVIKILQ